VRQLQLDINHMQELRVTFFERFNPMETDENAFNERMANFHLGLDLLEEER
jgi:hypothetical protein